jgi:chemotaxis signal transduction protein
VTASTQAVPDQYCVFRAADAVWAVSAAATREVADMVPIVPVPDAPEFLLGVCHLRTELLPVLDLQALLGSAGRSAGKCDYLLILHGREGEWSVPIERAVSMQPLEIAISSSRGDLGGRLSAVLGTATFRDEVIRVVDAAVLYRHAMEALDQHWSPEAERDKRSFHHSTRAHV